MTTWSMFPRVPGTRRSCSVTRPWTFRRASPSFRSPTAPRSHAVVDCGSSTTASRRPPRKSPTLPFTRSSRRAFRRSYSRDAEAPAVPCSRSCRPSSSVGQSVQRTVLAAWSYSAQLCLGSSVPQTLHLPANLSCRRRTVDGSDGPLAMLSESAGPASCFRPVGCGGNSDKPGRQEIANALSIAQQGQTHTSGRR